MTTTKKILTLTPRPQVCRSTLVVDALRSGISLRSKTWSKNGRFASSRDERRAAKRNLQRERE